MDGAGWRKFGGAAGSIFARGLVVAALIVLVFCLTIWPAETIAFALNAPRVIAKVAFVVWWLVFLIALLILSPVIFLRARQIPREIRGRLVFCALMAWVVVIMCVVLMRP